MLAALLGNPVQGRGVGRRPVEFYQLQAAAFAGKSGRPTGPPGPAEVDS